MGLGALRLDTPSFGGISAGGPLVWGAISHQVPEFGVSSGQRDFLHLGVTFQWEVRAWGPLDPGSAGAGPIP